MNSARLPGYFILTIILASLTGCSRQVRTDTFPLKVSTSIEYPKRLVVSATKEELISAMSEVYRDNGYVQVQSDKARGGKTQGGKTPEFEFVDSDGEVEANNLSKHSCRELLRRAESLWTRYRFNINVALHVLAVDERGDVLPLRVKITGPDCPDDDTGFVITENYHIDRDKQCPTLPAAFRNLGAHGKRDVVQDELVADIVCNFWNFKSKLKKTVKPVIYTFIHGGLNDFADSKDRVLRDVFRMLSKTQKKDDAEAQYYPLYLIWPSGMTTYTDSLAHYDQGQWDTVPEPRNWLLAGVRLLFRDIPRITAEGMNSYSQALLRFKDRQTENAYDCESLRGYLHYSEEYDFFEKAYGCLKQPAEPKQETPNLALENATDAVLSPAKVLTIPMANTLGSVAWKNMLARARFTTRKPCVDVYAEVPSDKKTYSNPCGIGPYARLFERFDDLFKETVDRQATRSLKKHASTTGSPFAITLVGHSMGSIVASDLISQFPDLPYDDVVFLGAAVSIREFVNSVAYEMGHRIMHDNKPFQFYSLSLDFRAEAEEVDGFGVLPVGSLLEWIDGMYETPSDFLERTLGKWKNVVASASYFSELEKSYAGGAGKRPREKLSNYMHFGMFDRSCGSPLQHGEMASSTPGYPFCSRGSEGSRRRIFGQNNEGAYWNADYWQWASCKDKDKCQ